MLIKRKKKGEFKNKKSGRKQINLEGDAFVIMNEKEIRAEEESSVSSPIKRRLPLYFLSDIEDKGKKLRN